MPMVCKLCSHPDRLKADQMIIRGEPNSRIASKFGCSETAVRRHRAHIAEVLSKGFEKQGIRLEDELVSQVKDLLAKSQAVYEKSQEYLKDDDGNPIRAIHPDYLRAIGYAINDQRQIIETLAKLMGAWKSTEINVTQINLVQIAPVIYKVLERHPAALRDVQEALLVRPS